MDTTAYTYKGITVFFVIFLKFPSSFQVVEAITAVFLFIYYYYFFFLRNRIIHIQPRRCPSIFRTKEICPLPYITVPRDILYLDDISHTFKRNYLKFGI